MPRLSYSKRNAIRQAVELQKFCFSCAELLEADLRASADKEERARIATALGGLGRNWTALQDSIRILKGDPLPGSLRPEKRNNTKGTWPSVNPYIERLSSSSDGSVTP